MNMYFIILAVTPTTRSLKLLWSYNFILGAMNIYTYVYIFYTDPIMKNGSRGPPILLKRPKDATVLKVHPNYKVRASPSPPDASKGVRREKQVRMTRTTKPIVRQREKLVCPICGILTFTLGNHIATHQGMASSTSYLILWYRQ